MGADIDGDTLLSDTEGDGESGSGYDAMSRPGAATVLVDSVVFRESLYPRIKTDYATVQKYAEDLSVLPPIEINQHNELIDGWHRWTAHKKQHVERIPVIVTETGSDAELLELAIERNAAFGLQLSQEDKRDVARSIYNATPERERDAKKVRLAKILSVSERTIREWLSRIDKDSKEARNRRIFDLWMACYTGAEIALEVGCDEKTVTNVVSGILADLPDFQKPAASHLTDFEPPIYNVWKQQEKTPGAKHFGNSEVRWLDNLLYLYTKPFDVVVDPFAGGGSTVDLCRKRFRRYWASDRKPIVGREKEVRKLDLTEDWPTVRWGDVSLIYLDPPYWAQAAGEYSDDPTDLANMDLDRFNETLSGIITNFAKRIKASKREEPSYVALIIQPTQWNAPKREFTDHIGDMLRAVRLPVDMRYSVPYESQQYNAQMVEWAKAQKKCLVLTREIVVWKVAAKNDGDETGRV